MCDASNVAQIVHVKNSGFVTALPLLIVLGVVALHEISLTFFFPWMLVAQLGVFWFNIYFSELVLSWYCKWNWNNVVLFAICVAFWLIVPLNLLPDYTSNRIYTIISCIPNLIDQWFWYRSLSEVMKDMLYGGTMQYNRENKFLDVWIVTVHLYQVFLYFSRKLNQNYVRADLIFFFLSLAQCAQSRSLCLSLSFAFHCYDRIWGDNKEPITANNIFHLQIISRCCTFCFKQMNSFECGCFFFSQSIACTSCRSQIAYFGKHPFKPSIWHLSSGRNIHSVQSSENKAREDYRFVQFSLSLFFFLTLCVNF